MRPMDLVLQIEEIIEKNGSDFELSKLFKQYIKEYKDSLPELFEKNQGKDFLVKHTKKLDSIIALMYKTVLRRAFGHYLPMRGSIPIAIIALGSYGREQLCVHSDIDLLIVYEDLAGFNTKLIIEKLFYLALDAGLKLGHRVHEVQDLFGASNEDITIKTSLMESRLITGSSFTWQITQKELNRIRLFEQKEFLLAKLEEAQIRRKKHPFSMQPHVKESVGGLRDSQLMFWIAHTLYGVTSLKDLTQVQFSDEEYREYRIALELLFRVRSALHLITNKQEDRLLLEYIPQVSTMLGFKNHKKMAQKVLEALWRVNNFTQIFVKKMMRPILFEKESISVLRKNRLDQGIFLLENRLYASYSLQTIHINDLLELLISLKDLHYQFDAGFLRIFTYSKIPYPLHVKTYALLKELLAKKNVYCFLKLFYDAGILHKLFSNFRNVLHLPQFDGYHHYPVDIHSIECVKALENIKEPFIQKLYEALNKEERTLLKLVVLLHDTGKGRKQDHSELGAKTILPFAVKLKFSSELQNRASLLVRHHILMSNVAFKENIHSEKILYKFMSSIEDSKNLQLLYILTYADINGVGGDTYNSFSSKLLYELYHSALEVSVNNDRITEAKKRINIEKKVKNHPSFATLPKLLQTKLIRIESNLFFFMHEPSDIIHIALKAKETQEYSYDIATDTALSIEIYRKIPLNISYLLATLSYLDVGSMEVVTLFDDTKYFKIEFLKNIEDVEIPKIEKVIEQAFDMSKEVVLNDIKIDKEEITIDCEHSLTLAQLSVHTSNQRGLLAYIMDKFEQLHINIVSAKVHSTKYKVRDTFLMQKQNELCNNVENIYNLLTQ
jgi:[protein-PII] uridylyltransferase